MKITVIALFLIIREPVLEASPWSTTEDKSSGTAYYTSTYRPRFTRRITCKVPLEPLNGIWVVGPSASLYLQDDRRVYTNKTIPVGYYLTIRCFDGYRFQNSSNTYVRCDEDGTWMGDIPACEEVYCKDLNSASIVVDCKGLGSEYVTCNSSRPGTIATLKCRDRYRTEKTLSLFKSVMCNTAGVWVPQPLHYVPAVSHCDNYGLTCASPPQPQNGFWNLKRAELPFTEESNSCRVGQVFPPGTHLVYSCNSGFKISGSAHVFCGVDGEWSEGIPVCADVRCEDLNSASIQADCRHRRIKNVTCNSPIPGTIATLKCRNSYYWVNTIHSSPMVLCNDIGQWEPDPLRCIPAAQSLQKVPVAMTALRQAMTRCEAFDASLTCAPPPQPQNGFWELKRAECTSPEECCLVGQEFPPGTHLVYSCNSGFKISGSAHVFCGVDGEWSEGIPVCEDVRCEDLNSASIQADCRHHGIKNVTCNSPIPGTIATLKCRNSYYADKTLPLSTEVTCNDIGQWEPEPLRCIPECGVVATRATPLIVKGTDANIAEFPWHATLYIAENSTAKKEFICGGSIIQERLVITAAHCVYNVNTNRKDDPSKYFVATGNIFRDYDSPFHNSAFVQKTAVKNIYVDLDYNGQHGYFYADIAIVEVTVAFVFSALRQPICMDYYDNIDLDTGMFGRVTGFGRTAFGESSYLLQTIEVPYVNQTKCREASNTYETQNYVTNDKFCAGYTNGSAVCDGDSGGGLVFKHNSLWYLQGIVSVSLRVQVVNGTRQCDSYTYSLYTKVSMYMKWIKCHINLQEKSQQVKECSNYVH